MTMDGAEEKNELWPRSASSLTHACCDSCRIRFSPATAAYLTACPACGEPPRKLDGLEAAVGYRLFRVDDIPHRLPEAIEVAMPNPDHLIKRGNDRGDTDG